MSDEALTVYMWLVAVAVWASLLIPESDKLGQWLQLTFNTLARPIRWATWKLFGDSDE